MDVSKLNKSFTRSEPNLLNCRQVSVTEYFHQPGSERQLIRHYSFKELQGTPAGYAQFNDQFLIPSSYQTQFQDHSIFNHLDNCVQSPTLSITSQDDLHYKEENFEETMKEHNDSPMDIDQSADHIDTSIKENNWKRLNIQSPTDTEEDKKEIQVMGMTPIEKIAQKQSSTNKSFLVHLCLGICFSIVAIFLFFNNNTTLKDSSVIAIEENLKSLVFNQNHIIDTLVDNLNKIHTTSDFKKLLILVGSTGVGKTFILNLIRSQYSSHLFISLNYVVDKDIIELKKNISLPKQCFIMSIDDLKMEHISTAESYIKSLSNKCLLIIPVFNIQETSDDLNHVVRFDHFKQIAKYFGEHFVTSETLLLNAMDRKHLGTWLRNEIEKRGIDFNKHSNFIESLIESHDVDSYGFKGIIPKISLLDN